MFSDSFKQLEHGKAAEILDQLNPLLDGAPYDTTSARVLTHPLPFYVGHCLVQVSDDEVSPPRRIAFVYKETEGGSRIHILNGTNEPIYHLNKVVPIFLNEEHIGIYARFFFSYVRGRFGRFLVVQSTDEISWREEPTPAAKKALGKMIEPIILKKIDDTGTFHLQASIVFKDSLFQSDIAVSENGDVSLSNQELLVEDIPVIDDNFSQ